jgi:hypothetical protein
MRSSALRYSVVVAGLAGLALAGVPSAQAGATHATHAGKHSIGDSCLVGTWQDSHGRSSTRWNGHRVVMRAGGGDVDHISASGIDHDDWSKSLPLVGHYLGHKLTEKVRGHNTQLIHSLTKNHHLEMRITERGWTAHSSNRYVYRGKHSTGYLNQTGVNLIRYRCNANTLTFLGPKGHVTGHETRLSDQP